MHPIAVPILVAANGQHMVLTSPALAPQSSTLPHLPSSPSESTLASSSSSMTSTPPTSSLAKPSPVVPPRPLTKPPAMVCTSITFFINIIFLFILFPSMRAHIYLLSTHFTLVEGADFAQHLLVCAAAFGIHIAAAARTSSTSTSSTSSTSNEWQNRGKCAQMDLWWRYCDSICRGSQFRTRCELLVPEGCVHIQTHTHTHTRARTHTLLPIFRFNYFVHFR